MDKKKILILGAGFGGVRVALDLAKMGLKNAQITLVSNKDYHEYHPDLYEVAATFLPWKENKREEKIMFENLDGTVAIPLKTIFKNKEVEIVVGQVTGINVNEKSVAVDEQKLSYDILVIALGSTTNYFGIPGLGEKSLPLKTVGDALNIRNEVDELFWQKKPGEEINIIVGGGGFTGSELVGKLASFLASLVKSRGHDHSKVHLSVIEAAPNLLTGAAPWLQQEALKRLTKLGVKVHLESKITGIEEKELILEDGNRHGFDLLIWTAGIKVNPLVAEIEGIEHEKNSCLAIEENLRVKGAQNVFAIGDNSLFWNPDHTHPLPATAQLAIEQGERVAKNIARTLNNQSLAVFKGGQPQFVVPLGSGYALSEILGVRISGVLGWWLKRAVSLNYLMSILPFTEALKAWRNGVSFFIKS